MAVEGAETKNRTVGPGLTVMLFDVPVMEEVTVSVAVMVWVPACLFATLKVPAPLMSVESPVALTKPGSVLVRWTVPV